MVTENDSQLNTWRCIDCVTGVLTEITSEYDRITGYVTATSGPQNLTSADGKLNLPFIGPGLIDLQINGVNGIDFNNAALTEQEVIDATYYLLSRGVTTFLPTVITNSVESICSIVSTIKSACLRDHLVDDCIAGIHLEGPFLSPVPGAKGAHNEAFLKKPDWALFLQFQEAAGGKIRFLTIAPELEGAFSFISKCSEQGVLVSIGHSMANIDEIKQAVAAGATLCTHLGNAVPLSMPRHPNILWDLLSTDELYACVIADGIHVPDSFLKVVLKTKGRSALVVSDATCFAGMTPGEYKNHIGGSVVLDAQKRVSLKSEPGLLAGAAKDLLENVETLISHKLVNIGEAWRLASTNVASMLAGKDDSFANKQDYVIFRFVEDSIEVQQVIKNNKIVYHRN
jgi:N-acetylglucosamine-6-phosphate deacetylase